MEEGAAIRRADADYREEQQRQQALEQQRQFEINQKLLAVKNDTRDRKEAWKCEEAQQQQRNEAWLVRKEKQTTLKKQFEQKWFK